MSQMTATPTWNSAVTAAVTQFEQGHYARRLVPEDDGGFSASIHEFPGCFAEGDTADEALQRLNEAAVAWIHASVEAGRLVPAPVDVSEYSGKVALRMPRSLHGIAAERALVEGCSINQLLVTAIAHYLGQADGLTASVGHLRSAVFQMGSVSWNPPLNTQVTVNILWDKHPINFVASPNKPERLEALSPNLWQIPASSNVLKEAARG